MRNGGLAVRNFGGPTNLVIDINGYYTQQIQALIRGNGSVFSGSSHIRSSLRNGTGSYVVTLDGNVDDCAVPSTPFGDTGEYASADMENGNHVHLFVWVLSNGAVPTLVDAIVYFTVTC